MRKILLCILAAFAFQVAAFSQQIPQWQKLPVKDKGPKKAKVHIGGSMLGSRDRIYFTEDYIQRQPLLINFAAGLVCEDEVLPNFSVGIQSLAALKQFSVISEYELPVSLGEYHSYVRRYHQETRLICLRMPLTCHFNVTKKSTLQPYVFVSPCLNYVFGGNVNWYRKDATTDAVLDEVAIDVGDANIKRVQYGMSAGIGVRWKMNRETSYCLLKFDIGITQNFGDDFSKTESTGQLGIDNLFGINAIDYERFGKRHKAGLEANLSVLMPLRKHLDSCDEHWRKAAKYF